MSDDSSAAEGRRGRALTRRAARERRTLAESAAALALTPAWQSELLRSKYLFDSPLLRLQEEMATRDDLIRRVAGMDGLSIAAARIASDHQRIGVLVDRVLGRSALDAVRLLDEVAKSRLSQWLQGSTTMYSVQPHDLDALDRLARRQVEWASSLARLVETTSFRAVAAAAAESPELEELAPEVEIALRAAALEAPEAFAPIDDRIPEITAELMAEIAGELSQPQGGDAPTRSMGEAVRAILARLNRTNGPALMIAVQLIFNLVWQFGPEIAGDEWGRMRDQGDGEVVQRQNAEIREELRRLREEVARLRQVPRQAVVARRAWLRAQPSTAAERRGPILSPGTRLVVYQAEGGWIRVEVDGVPGEVRTGWIYGRLARWVH